VHETSAWLREAYSIDIARRYVYHTLKNSVNTVPTIAQADAIYVYDYCYVMWALGDHHVRGHWWLKERYNPERKAGFYLLSAYRCCPPRAPKQLPVPSQPEEHSSVPSASKSMLLT
jgi:hypothetical protein